MLDVAGVVILYFPDDNLTHRLNSYLNDVKHLYVIDNTDLVNENYRLFQHEKITYLSDGENKGISIRLNQAADLAIKAGFNWLLTMDQDSYFPENALSNYFDCMERYPHKNETAMFGVQSLTENIAVESCQPEEVNHLITSGSILNLSLFKSIGLFDEALFIDRVDHEYCLRARARNFKIVRFNNIFMHHKLGTIKWGRSLKNFRLTPRVVHSPVRMYYIVRNYFYLSEKYKGQFQNELEEMMKENWLRSKNNFLYGSKRFKLLRYLVKAYLDYKKGKMGKIRE
jgi:rhamnosyltransferase